MSYPITHVTVKDNPPPRQVISVGRIYPLYQEEPETVFRTVERVEEDEKSLEDAEVKVVRRGRRPKPAATEGAETK